MPYLLTYFKSQYEQNRALLLLSNPNYLFNIQYLHNMKVIIKEGLHKFDSNQRPSLSQLTKFVELHPFYTPAMRDKDLISQLEKALQKKYQLGSRGQSQQQQYKKNKSLEQLALYLNRETNTQIFTVFEHILNNPRGTTYEAISKRLKTDIITISHYCCKLKKLRMIDWQHEKQGVIVFPKRNIPKEQNEQISYSPNKNQNTYDINSSFLFRELTINENIWINISGAQSISRGGFTNEEIKRKIMKHSENKMVRRTVESIKYFEKTAERQGKVFEFKYKNQTEHIKLAIQMKEQAPQQDETQIQNLNQTILYWLKNKFPEFQGEYFLRDLINNKFKDYFSSLGVKQSKRQCTPLKLNRYIKVLNYLNMENGMKESQLRNLIVKDQSIFNIGIMHKRSLMGILQGLKNLQIIFQDDGYYYPGWITSSEWKRRQDLAPIRGMKEDDQEINQLPKKRIHLDPSVSNKQKKNGKRNSIDKNNTKNTQYVKITQKEYRLQLFVALLAVDVNKAVQRCYRKAFNRIMYVDRKKIIQKFVPQLHVLHLLEDNKQRPITEFDHTLQSFYNQLDSMVQKQGLKQQLNCQPQNELIKFIRKNPIKSANSLRIKYGRNWPSKFQDVSRQNIVQINQNGIQISSIQGYLI